MAKDIQDRFRGSLLGLAIGDAVGTTVEFQPRGSFAPVTDMTGGGPYRLEPGEWTDDTSMAWLQRICQFLYCEAPSACYGSFAAVQQWIGHKGLTGLVQFREDAKKASEVEDSA